MQFTLKGQNFSFGGANNYYLAFAPKPQVDDVFDNANKAGIPVLRSWAFNVIGNPQGGSSWPPNVQDYIGDYFHYWDTNSQSSKFNEGANGLERLDYMVKKAKDFGVKLLLVLTNNWGEYGGSEQMNLWYGVNYHDDFFTFDKTKMEHKKWVSYLLNRKNKFTGVAYKDEEAIFAWELINEVRCKGCIDIKSCSDCKACKASSTECTADKVTAWVAEMAKYVKSIDK